MIANLWGFQPDATFAPVIFFKTAGSAADG